MLGFHYLSGNIAAWIISVLFAYITNRLFVFSSQVKGAVFVIRECAAFFACRLFSGVVDTTAMYVLIDLLHSPDILVKVSVNAVVIIFNYVVSKQVVFKKENRDEDEVRLT